MGERCGAKGSFNQSILLPYEFMMGRNPLNRTAYKRGIQAHSSFSVLPI